jgi:DNA-directed RNA polymerase I, II, and III subunit RPABC1
MASETLPIKTLLDRLGLEISEASRYLKIKTTIVEMMKDRGYTVSEEEEKSIIKLANFIGFLYKKKTDTDEESLIDFFGELMDDRIINIENPELIEDFMTNYSRELIEKMDADSISERIQKEFKVSSKQTRLLNDSVNGWVGRRKENNSIENLVQIYKKNVGDEEELLCVYYFYNSENTKKETKRRINDVIVDILNIQKKNKKLKNILFVSESKLNTMMVDDLRKYKEKMNISIFLGDNLLFNCTKHFLVPKHVLLSDEQRTEFLNQTKEKNFTGRLPKIFETDPISRYFGAVPGQIFKIQRESLQDDLMVRFSDFYRVVVSEVKK